MLINLRNALMAGKRLPYDAEVEYLESTGTQYIDAGILATQAFGCEITIEDVATPNYNCFIKNVTNNDFSIGSNSGNTQSSYLRIRGALTWANNIGANKTFIIKNGIITANWAQVGTYDQTLSLGTGANSVGLFANAVGGNPAQCKIFSCKLYDANNLLVRDFIPVRKGTVGYLYDRVSGKLFGNAGTGDFVLGPDVVPVEYLQSSGTQYIDTLVTADSNLSVEITMANAGTPWSNVNPMGAILSSPRARHHLNFNATHGIMYYFCTGDTSTFTYIKPSDGKVFTYKVDAIAKTLSIDSSTFSLPNNTFDLGMTYWLFGRNGTTPPYLGSLRIYSAKLWNGSTLVRDYIPVRVGTVGYLYDRVSGKLFGNDGSGAFTYGNDLKYPIPAE